MNFDETVSKMDTIDLGEIENLDKLDFEIGVVWEDSLERGGQRTPVFYLFSKSIYFKISEESARRIANRIDKIKRAKEDYEIGNGEDEDVNIKKQLGNMENSIKRIEKDIERMRILIANQ